MDTVLIEPSAASASRHLSLRFTGSGSEYFRIWIVNLLLTLVTLGIYLPWAKVRRLRYFYGNTLVGAEPLAFHGDPLLMLRGYAVMAVAFIAYGVVSRLSAFGSLLALLILAVVWPALWRASMQFRMANTSWRGMRFAFVGSLGDAYRAFLPVLLPGLLLAAGGVLAREPDGRPAPPSPWLGLLMLVALLFLPLALYWIRRYQHGHYAYGHEQTTLRTGPGSFYTLCLKAFGMVLVVFIVAGAAVATMIYSISHGGSAPGRGAGLLSLLPLTLVVLLYAAIGPFVAARFQNLLWNATASRRIGIDSALRARALIGLTLKVWLLMLVTLGFYWPFARVALARLRLEAVSVGIEGGAEALSGDGILRQPGAAGDAAGEFFGIDLGL